MFSRKLFYICLFMIIGIVVIVISALNNQDRFSNFGISMGTITIFLGLLMYYIDEQIENTVEEPRTSVTIQEV